MPSLTTLSLCLGFRSRVLAWGNPQREVEKDVGRAVQSGRSGPSRERLCFLGEEMLLTKVHVSHWLGELAGPAATTGVPVQQWTREGRTGNPGGRHWPAPSVQPEWGSTPLPQKREGREHPVMTVMLKPTDIPCLNKALNPVGLWQLSARHSHPGAGCACGLVHRAQTPGEGHVLARAVSLFSWVPVCVFMFRWFTQCFVYLLCLAHCLGRQLEEVCG